MSTTAITDTPVTAVDLQHHPLAYCEFCGDEVHDALADCLRDECRVKTTERDGLFSGLGRGRTL